MTVTADDVYDNLLYLESLILGPAPVRTLLDDSGLPGDFWVLAAQYSVYVRNRCPRASNPGGVSP